MNRRAARRFLPSFTSLEPRRLLSEAGVSIQQDGQDYTGFATGINPDGFQDADLLITNLRVGPTISKVEVFE